MWGIAAERSGPRHGRDLRSYPKVTAKAVCVGLEFAAERERRRGPVSVLPLNACRTRDPFRRILIVARAGRGRERESPGAGGRRAGQRMMAPASADELRDWRELRPFAGA